MIDTHCHVDFLPDPVGTSRRLETELSACVAVTFLPEHYEMARRHLAGHRRVLPALGAHPLRSRDAARQMSQFAALAVDARYIGEVGLDASAEGKPTLSLQREVFSAVVRAIRPNVFVTVHSRGAWRETLDVLKMHNIGPVCFHYFTGGPEAAAAVVSAGHFLSVNQRMISQESRHRAMVAGLPRQRVLVESDAPFTGNSDPITLLKPVYAFLSDCWQIDAEETAALVRGNFSHCRTICA